jgi:hypothetical protein
LSGGGPAAYVISTTGGTGRLAGISVASLRPVRPWRVPSRSELLPVSEAQSCCICGDGDWRWLRLLLNAPAWVQEVGWFANWFVAVCQPCEQVWDNDEALRLRWEMNGEHQAGAVPDFDEYRRVVSAMQSEPPLRRAVAVAV